MLCEICGEWALGKTMCSLCRPIFNDMDKFPFSTATIQIKFTTTYFKTQNPPDVRVQVKKRPISQKLKRELIDKAQKARKSELSKLFSVVERNGDLHGFTTEFKSNATRATSSLLQKRNRELNLKKKGKDSFYNSATIKKTHLAKAPGATEFKTSCLLFFNSGRITLGMWTYRKQIASDYIRLIRSVLGPHRFKITGMKTIFVNAAIKFFPCCLSPLPPLTSPLPPEFFAVEKAVNNVVVFNLSHVYEVIKDAYEKTTHLRVLKYNPLMTNQNKIHICVVGRGGGSLSLFRTGTVMELGFSRLQTIVEEFLFLTKLLQEKFNYPVNNQLELYKRRKLQMGGEQFLPINYPNFLM